MRERLPVAPPSGNIEADSGGLICPRYELVCRSVRQLAPGDLMIEPSLGEVRIAAIVDGGWDELRQIGLRQLYWVDDNGLSTAARMLREDASAVVRIPALADRAYLTQALDQADYFQRDISEHSARLIAAHLHRGVGSGLYDFAARNDISARIYTELNEIRLHPARILHRWATALGTYCLHRQGFTS